MNLKWYQLKEYLETLSDEALKGDVLISNPSDKLHVSSGVRTATENDTFSKGTLYLSAGGKRYKYWISEKPTTRTVYLCRGTDVVEEYKVIRVRKNTWIEELKNWEKWDHLTVESSPLASWVEIDEETANQFLGLIGTSW